MHKDIQQPAINLLRVIYCILKKNITYAVLAFVTAFRVQTVVFLPYRKVL